MPVSDKRKSRPIALITSDCHLQDRAWASRPTLAGDAYWSFEWMLRFAAETNIPAVVAAGDVIDKPRNDSFVVDFLRERLTESRDQDVDFLFIQGQFTHDQQPHVPWISSICPWARWLADDQEFYLGSHRVWGIDWTPKTELPARLDEIPEDTEILVMHQVCDEWMGSITNPELSFDQIPTASHLIVGDYHGFSGELDRVGRDGQDLRVLCPGSTAMQAIDEPVDKYCYVLYEDLTTRRVRIPTRIVLKPHDMLFEEDVDAFVERVAAECEAAATKARDELELPEELHKPIVYVRYQHGLPDAYGRLARAVGERGHFFHKELRAAMEESEEETQDRERRREVIEGGLVGALPQVVDPDQDPEVFRLCGLLLEDRMPQRPLATLRHEYLGPEDSDGSGLSGAAEDAGDAEEE